MMKGLPMPARRLLSISAGLAVIAALASIASAQTPPAAPSAPKPMVPTVTRADPNLPRTSFGQPSLEGIWTSNYVLPLEAVPQAPMLVLPEAAAKQMASIYAKAVGDALDAQLDPEIPALMKTTDGLAVVRGERRTRAVVEPADGKIPYTPEGRKEASRGPSMGAMNNVEERPNWERCVRSLAQPPVTAVGETNPRYIVQTPTQVVIFTEYGGEARIIPFTDKHRPKMFAGLLGDSIARWDGNTLVVETINLPETDRVRLFPTFIVSNEATVIERYTRMSDKELLYQFTVVDPKVYMAPWLAEFSIYKTDQRLFEHACHEGNYALPNILRGARIADEKKAQPAKVASAKP
jgi:hypothetical protein